MKLWLWLSLLLFWAQTAAAVLPHEMLADPAQEARAQHLDELLRCVVCRSENLASSRSDWASDARILVRELIAEGNSDAEVLAFFQARYGDYVLMEPVRSGGNLVLWGAAPVLALLGLWGAAAFVRASRQGPETAQNALDAGEEARLRRLLDEEERG